MKEKLSKIHQYL